jgi:hypothetical protein
MIEKIVELLESCPPEYQGVFSCPTSDDGYEYSCGYCHAFYVIKFFRAVVEKVKAENPLPNHTEGWGFNEACDRILKELEVEQ